MDPFWNAFSTYFFNTPVLKVPDSLLMLAIAMVMAVCLLISFYLWVLYGAVLAVKRLTRSWLGPRGGYYCWYTLFFCLSLSTLPFNDNFILFIYFMNKHSMSWIICCLLALLWFFVSLYKLEDRIITNIKLTRIVASMRRCTELDALAARAASVFGLRSKSIKVVASAQIPSPVSYGVCKKYILIPHDYASRYTQDELYMLLLHEMAHISNKDTVKLFMLGLPALLFFFPPGFKQNFIKDSEILCDNKVMSLLPQEQDTYADLLIRECEAPLAPIKGLAFSDSYLMATSRLDALYDYKPELHRPSMFGLVILSVALLSFFHIHALPAPWLSVYGTDNPQYEVFVSYEGENENLTIVQPFTEASDAVTEAAEEEQKAVTAPTEATETATEAAEEGQEAGAALTEAKAALEAETQKRNRPGKEYFSHTVTFLPDGSMRVDKLALRKAVQDWTDGQISYVTFHLKQYQINHDKYKTNMFSSFNYFTNELVLLDESAPEAERYEIMKREFDLSTQMLLFITNWF